MRYSLHRVEDGPWLVLDGQNHRKTVATCREARVAEVLVAVLNGDIEAAASARGAAEAEFGRICN
jgi:hypothetical protein